MIRARRFIEIHWLHIRLLSILDRFSVHGKRTPKLIRIKPQRGHVLERRLLPVLGIDEGHLRLPLDHLLTLLLFPLIFFLFLDPSLHFSDLGHEIVPFLLYALELLLFGFQLTLLHQDIGFESTILFDQFFVMPLHRKLVIFHKFLFIFVLVFCYDPGIVYESILLVSLVFLILIIDQQMYTSLELLSVLEECLEH